MKYDDFPILDNTQYETINKHFTNNITSNRKDLLINICQELNNCAVTCTKLFTDHNTKIKQALTTTNSILLKLFNNLTSLFSLNPINTFVSNSNIFNLLKRITKILSLVHTWEQTEEKTYYLSIANKTIIDILECFNLILNSLEISNIKFYKHM